MRISQKARVLAFLTKRTGRNTFSAAQARNYFGIQDVSRVVSRLRAEGYAVYLNDRRRGDGSPVKVYRLGTPSRSFKQACRAKGVSVKFVK